MMSSNTEEQCFLPSPRFSQLLSCVVYTTADMTTEQRHQPDFDKLSGLLQAIVSMANTSRAADNWGRSFQLEHQHSVQEFITGHTHQCTIPCTLKR